MIFLVLGMLLFGGIHFWSMFFPEAARVSKQSQGEARYMGGYSLVSALGILLMAFGYWWDRSGDLDRMVFYEPNFALKHFAMLLIFLGFIFIFSNLSKGYIARYLHHPFSIGIALLSTAHLMMNGERAVVLIFGLFLAISLADIFLSFARGKFAEHHPNYLHDLRGLGVGLFLFLVFAFGFHPYVLKMPVI